MVNWEGRRWCGGRASHWCGDFGGSPISQHLSHLHSQITTSMADPPKKPHRSIFVTSLLIAQSVEHRTHNRNVEGSSPTRRQKNFVFFMLVFDILNALRLERVVEVVNWEGRRVMWIIGRGSRGATTVDPHESPHCLTLPKNHSIFYNSCCLFTNVVNICHFTPNSSSG